jgi:ankyrin repeat protein
MILKKTYSANKADKNGNTLIHIAAQSGNIELTAGFCSNSINTF